MEEYKHHIELFVSRKKEHKRLFQTLKKNSKGKLDQMFSNAHDEVFEEIDCLKCANCCKSISPIVTQRDIERLAKYFRIKPGEVIEQYLKLDEDRDYVMKSTPCPFLGDDNYCSIYEARPTACKGYPHTNERGMNTLLKLAKQNVSYCPAVAGVLNTLSEQLLNSKK